MTQTGPNLLFIINQGSGNNKTDWEKEVSNYCNEHQQQFDVFTLPQHANADQIKQKIKQFNPGKIIAVGGDGTVKMVAEAILNSSLPLAILPAGSANGMARELNIPDEPAKALETAINGPERNIHGIKINDELCIHLSDIGFNAYVVKKFQDNHQRGMWGYIKAAWKVLWSHYTMFVTMNINGKKIERKAAMVVVANATQYGNGVVINPEGSIYDSLFEIVLIKKISFSEIFKMRFTKKAFDPSKTESFQVNAVDIVAHHKTHFQVDGEYRGRIKSIHAELLPGALKVVIGDPGK